MQETTVSRRSFEEMARLPVISQARVIALIDRLHVPASVNHCVNIRHNLFAVYSPETGITRGVMAWLTPSGAFIAGIFMKTSARLPPEIYHPDSYPIIHGDENQYWTDAKRTLLMEMDVYTAYESEILKENIKNQLLKWRSAAGFTQCDLACLMGVSERHIANIEVNPLRVSVQTLYRYAKSCGVGEPNISLITL